MSAHSSPASKPLDPTEAPNAPTTKVSGSRSRAGSNASDTSDWTKEDRDALDRGLAALEAGNQDPGVTDAEYSQFFNDLDKESQARVSLANAMLRDRVLIKPEAEWSEDHPERNLVAYTSVGGGLVRTKVSRGIDHQIIYQGYRTRKGKKSSAMTIYDDGTIRSRFKDGRVVRSHMPGTTSIRSTKTPIEEQDGSEWKFVEIDEAVKYAEKKGFTEIWRASDLGGFDLPKDWLVEDEDETDKDDETDKEDETDKDAATTAPTA